MGAPVPVSHCTHLATNRRSPPFLLTNPTRNPPCSGEILHSCEKVCPVALMQFFPPAPPCCAELSDQLVVLVDRTNSFSLELSITETQNNGAHWLVNSFE